MAIGIYTCTCTYSFTLFIFTGAEDAIFPNDSRITVNLLRLPSVLRAAGQRSQLLLKYSVFWHNDNTYAKGNTEKRRKPAVTPTVESKMKLRRSELGFALFAKTIIAPIMGSGRKQSETRPHSRCRNPRRGRCCTPPGLCVCALFVKTTIAPIMGKFETRTRPRSRYRNPQSGR